MSRRSPIPLHWGADTPEERGPVVFRFEDKKHGNAFGIPRGNWGAPSAIAHAFGHVQLGKPDYSLAEQSFALVQSPDWKKISSFDPYGSQPKHFTTFADRGVIVRPTGVCIKTPHFNEHIASLVQSGALQPDGHIIRPDGTYDVHNVVFEQIWHLPGIAERIGVGQTELRKKLFSAFAKGDVHIPLLKDNRFEVWAPNLGEVIISIFGDPAKLADPRVEVACRLHDSCMCGDKDSCRCSCKVTYNQAVEFCLRLAKNGGVGFIAEFLNEGRAMGLVDKHLIYLIREYFGDLPDDYFKSAEFLWGGEKKNDGRLPFVREDVLRLLLGGRRRGSEDKPTIHFLVSESPSKQSAIQGAGFQIGMQIGIDDQMMERRKVNPTEVHAKRKNGYSGNGNGNGHGHLEKTRAQKTESGVVVEDTVSPATRMRCTSASHPMECGCGERPQIVPA